MAIDVSELTDYSWANLAKAAKQAMMTAAVGGTELRMSDGRTIRRITMDEAKKLYAFATEQEQLESNETEGGGIALIEFGEPQ